MVGGALSGTVGTQQGLAAAGGAAPGAGDSVFGPGMIGERAGEGRRAQPLQLGAAAGAAVAAAGGSGIQVPSTRRMPPHMLQTLLPPGMDPTLGEPEARHGPLPRSSGSHRAVGSVAEELAAAQGTSQVGAGWGGVGCKLAVGAARLTGSWWRPQICGELGISPLTPLHMGSPPHCHCIPPTPLNRRCWRATW